MKETDETIYTRYLKTGMDDDLRELMNRHKDHLTLFLNNYVHNLEDAEDIMLDTFAVAASGISRFDGKSSFRTWLYAIGRKKAVSHLRKQKLHLFYLEERREDLSHHQTPEEPVLREERSRVVYSALQQIREEYRQVLYLLFFEEMSHEETAAVMRKNVKQVYNLAYQGKKALKDVLEKMGYQEERV